MEFKSCHPQGGLIWPDTKHFFSKQHLDPCKVESTALALQADNDHHVKDTYNYATVQADVKMPGRHFTYLEDDSRAAAFEGAIRTAVDRMHAEDKDARVLNLGCGAGLNTPLHVLARHGVLMRQLEPTMKQALLRRPSVHESLHYSI